MLRRGVAQYGVGQWAEIASALLPGRTGKQCRQHWEGALDPAVKKGAWTEAEVGVNIHHFVFGDPPRLPDIFMRHFCVKQLRLLDRLVQVHGSSCWSKVASLIEGRTNNQCRLAWLNHFKDKVMHLLASFAC